MNKFSIAALSVVLTLSLTSCNSTDKKITLNQVSHENNVVSGSVKGVDIYIDGSISMRGYMNVPGSDFTKKLSNLVNNPRKDLKIADKDLKINIVEGTELLPVSIEDILSKASNNNLFEGKETPLDEIFKKVSDRAKNNKNNVQIIISDCVLSYSGAELRNNPNANVNSAAALGGKITNALLGIKNSGLSVVVVKYLADFDSYYYFNCENQHLSDVPLDAKKKTGPTMSKRPYYMVVFGTWDNINAMFSKDVIPQGYTDVFAYNNEASRPNFTIVRDKQSGSAVNNTNNEVVIDTKALKSVQKKAPACYYLLVKDYSVLSCWNKQIGDIMSKPVVEDGQYISSISPEVLEQKNLNVTKNDDLTYTWAYKVVVKDEGSLAGVPNKGVDKIVFSAPFTDAKNSSIRDDRNVPVKNLEGKTFLFDTFIEGITECYSNKNTAEIRINTIKQ